MNPLTFSGCLGRWLEGSKVQRKSEPPRACLLFFSSLGSVWFLPLHHGFWTWIGLSDLAARGTAGQGASSSSVWPRKCRESAISVRDLREWRLFHEPNNKFPVSGVTVSSPVGTKASEIFESRPKPWDIKGPCTSQWKSRYDTPWRKYHLERNSKALPKPCLKMEHYCNQWFYSENKRLQ